MTASDRVVSGAQDATTTDDGAREEAAADQPTDLPRSAWPGVLKGTIREFRDDT